jgi:prepilin-type N-terminal cleavage/methylation domain-containing protein
MRREKAFTLIELLVVMAIIATLMTIAMPRYFNSLEASKETTLRQSLSACAKPWTTTMATPGVTPIPSSKWSSSATAQPANGPDRRTQGRLGPGGAADGVAGRGG